MILYHGSNILIDDIDLNRSKTGKDFGRGFYLSDNHTQALKQAQNTTYRLQEGEPLVTPFLFDEKILKSDNLEVKIFNDYSEEWAEFVFMNRQNKTLRQAHNYDIVYGPIADDTVGVQMRRFMEHYIDIHRLVEELRYNRGITFQYFFATDRAIKTLKRI